MSFEVEKFIFIDNHAHSLLKKYNELDEIGFRQSFSESNSLTVLTEHVPNSIHYMDLMDQLHRYLDIKTEQEFMSFRMSQRPVDYIQMLWDDASIGALIIDDGFASGETMSLDELSNLSQRPVFHCKRIEPLMEACFQETDSFEELRREFEKRLFPATTKRKSVSLKTICGYRGGLELMRPSVAEAELDFMQSKKKIAESKRKFRISASPLYHFLLLQAFEIAAQEEVPVQVHTGIGDDDADLVKCNPALMQGIFRSRAYSKTKFVLLHCYPYIREAAFMCSLYSNVFMDLSLSISLASPRAAKMVSEALALAPASKLLAGSDGHSNPESHWYGALCWKRGLKFSLYDVINQGVITQREAENIAGLVLHKNAINLYKLEGLV